MLLRTAILATLVLSSTASADVIGGETLTLTPGDGEITGGGFQIWAAHASDGVYVGGELAMGTYTSGPSDLAASLHALVGARADLSPRIALLADLGAGVSRQGSLDIISLGDEEPEGWTTDDTVASAAVRAHLVGTLGEVRGTRVGVALSADLRVAAGEVGAGGGAGLGLVFAR